jgi:hypothetical protein
MNKINFLACGLLFGAACAISAETNAAGDKISEYDSLYVVENVNGRWGIRARSSFAP